MPPKAKKESTELQVFNLENLNPALLPELATFKEIQLQVVAENPFVAIIDNTSRELAKKHRTARKTARTDLEKQDKLISSKFNEAKTKAKSYIAELIEYTLPGEIEQQTEINRDEAELEAKRQEKALLEQKRIDAIKKEIDDYYSTWNNSIMNMDFESIDTVSGDFLESYTSFDTTILEEFESLFPAKVEELNRCLNSMSATLINAENARLETIRLEAEAAELRIEAARLEALAKIAVESEAKAKAEREAFEKEKAEFVEKQIIAAKKERFEERKQILLNLGFTYEINREYNFSLTGVWSCFHEQIDDCTDEWFEEYLLDIKDAIAKKTIETPPTEKVEIPEILVPELPTVNVCTSEEIKNIEVIDAEIVTAKPAENTWDDIEKYFKASGEKSYSKWLKSNYNVPTKL